LANKEKQKIKCDIFVNKHKRKGKVKRTMEKNNKNIDKCIFQINDTL